jgi:hypothetical protein
MGRVRGLAGRFPGFQSVGAAASSASSSSSADAWSSSARSRRKSVAVPRRRPGRRGGSLHTIRCPGQVQGPPAGGSHRHLLCLLQLPVDRRPRHPEQPGQLGRVLLALRSSWSRCARCRGLSLGRLPFSLPRWRARAMPSIVRSRMMSTSNSAKAARMLKNTLPNGSLGVIDGRPDLQPGAAAGDDAGQRPGIGHRPGEPVEPGNDQGVPASTAASAWSRPGRPVPVPVNPSST